MYGIVSRSLPSKKSFSSFCATMGFNRMLRNLKICLLISTSLLIIVGFYIVHTSTDYHQNFQHLIKTLVVENEENDEKSASVTYDVDKIDWTDYEYLAKEKTREGPGEGGLPVILVNETQKELAQLSIQEYSYNGVASDLVSLDRSLRDTRHKLCLTRKYSKNLKPVSVVIAFHNEYLSFLLRTVHSIVNRTPKKLLQEIILVDDFSDKDYLFKDLDEHIANYKPDLVKIIRLKERSGLMKARMAGIREAKAEIVVIMDAHIEVNTNWLPPLLEPIVENPRIATEPMINFIHWDTLELDNDINTGSLGAFDWTGDYDTYRRTLRKGQSIVDNYQNPVVLGAFLAINREFFWELQGYDDGLEVWGGEQYDISFKIWLCGGQILKIPCSHAGHNYKEGGFHPFFNFKRPYIHQNYGRIAEVWFDEYKHKYYKLTARYNVPFGNVSKQLEFRKTCKPFKWYIDNVMPLLDYDFPVDDFYRRLFLFLGMISLISTIILIHLVIKDYRQTKHYLKLHNDIENR